MADDSKMQISKFSGVNFGFWKMQMEDYLYQKDLYLPLGGISKKPTRMSDEEWMVLDRKALSTIRLHLSSQVVFNIKNEKTTMELMATLSRMYEKPSATNKVFLMKRLFNLRMKNGSSVTDYLNDFNSLTAQLESVEISFDDEIRALLILSGLPDSWEGLVMAVSNSSSTGKLKFDDVVGVLLSEEVRRRGSSSSAADSSGSALNTSERGRQKGRRHRSKSRSKSRSRPPQDRNRGCWNCGKLGHFKRDCYALKGKQGDNTASTSKDLANLAVEGSDDDALILSMSTGDESWVIDSGASFHATSQRRFLRGYVKGDFGKVFLGDGEPCTIEGKGSTEVKIGGASLELEDVRHVPQLQRNLISVGQLASRGYRITFTDDQWKIARGSLVVASGKKVGTLYVTDGAKNSISVAATDTDARLWHCRLGHMSFQGMEVMHKLGKLQDLRSVEMDFCEDCVLGKQKRVSFNTDGHSRKLEKLDLVHTDVWGPAPVSSIGGSQYYVTFIDDATRKLWIFFLKHKSEVFGVFKKWRAEVELETGMKLKCLRSDNGGEYCSREFEDYCAEAGIVRQRTVPGSPQQNGVAERMNRTLNERARSMRLHAGLPLQFWAEAVNTAAYLINRGPSKKLELGIPEEAWTGKKIDLAHLRVFGCTGYVHVDSTQRSKLDAKSKKCIFVGYGGHQFGYRFWDPESRKIIRSNDVIFNEKEMQKSPEPEAKPAEPYFVDPEEESACSGQRAEPEQGAGDMAPPPQLRRSTRSNLGKPPLRYDGTLSYLLLTDSGEPECFQEALQVDARKEWELAMDDEMKSLEQNQTWELVHLPKGKKALSNKWVYRLKEEQDGKKRYKARLVIKGFQQRAGIDFTEIFSPVVKMSTIRTVLSMVAVEDLHLEQLDVKTAFLHGDLEEEIYMHQPEGYTVAGKGDLVCRLRKSLYGLKQAPRQWYLKFDSFMLEIGYRRCEEDHCCYFRDFGSSFLILLLYVDDMLVAGANSHLIADLKKKLSKKFAMKDLGAAKKILGMRISRDRSKHILRLSQAEYIGRVLERFSMEGAKPVSTPLGAHFKLSKEKSLMERKEEEDMSKIPYASAVGSLMYAMVCTRPDIAQAVGVVSRYMSCPALEHWKAVKWILRYLRGTRDIALCYGGSEFQLQGYVDSDYAGDLDSRKSTTGYLFTLGGGAVSWISKLQPIVALSTTEAEYVAATEACKEMIWLQGLMKELGKEQKNCRLHSDSQSAIHLAKNSAFHARTKHIDIRYHFVRLMVEQKVIRLEKIHTDKNPADMLTKTVPIEKLKACSASVGLRA